MGANTKTAKLIIDSKPINFYVYSTLLTGCLFIVGIIMAFVDVSDQNDMIAIRAALGTSIIAFLSCIIRLLLVRNLPKLRRKLSEEVDEEKAISIIIGSWIWWLSTLVAIGATFYYTLFLW